MPTASVLVGEKCKIVQMDAYNFSTMRLCHRCPRVTWRCVLRSYLALQLPAEVKADLMAVLEAHKPGPCVVNVLWHGHSNIQLPWIASRQWFSRTHNAAPTTFTGRARATDACSDRT